MHVIGGLCASECRENQALVREQPGKHSINLISEIAQYLAALYRVVDTSTIDMVIAALEALRHCAQDNLPTQWALLDRLIVDPLNFFFHQLIKSNEVYS